MTRSSGRPATCSTFTSAAPGTCSQRAGRSFSLLFQNIQVGAEDFHREIRSDAGDQLIEPHLDGLGESEADAGHLLLRMACLHLLDQIVPGCAL